MENTDKKIEASKNDALNFFKSLFDMKKLFFIDFIFFIHILVQILVLLGYFGGLFATGEVLKILGGALLYPFAFFGVRLMFEFSVVIFSINQNLIEVKKHLKK